MAHNPAERDQLGLAQETLMAQRVFSDQQIRRHCIPVMYLVSGECNAPCPLQTVVYRRLTIHSTYLYCSSTFRKGPCKIASGSTS